MLNIKVGQLPGKISEFVFEEGTTVADAIEMAGLDASGFEVRVDGQPAELNTTLTPDNTLVLLVKKIKGNR